MKESLKELRANNPVSASQLGDWVESEEGMRMLREILESPLTSSMPTSSRTARRNKLIIAAIIAISVLTVGVNLGRGPQPVGIEPAAAQEIFTRVAQTVSLRAPEPELAPGQYLYNRIISAHQAFDYGWELTTEVDREIWFTADGRGRILETQGPTQFLDPSDNVRCTEQLGDQACDLLLHPPYENQTRLVEQFDDPSHLSQLRLGQRELTYSEARALPTDPAALEQIMIEAGSGGFDRAEETFSMVADLLSYPLIPQDVAVAAYKVAARVPNTQLLGETRDQIGRSGTGIGLISHEPSEGAVSALSPFDSKGEHPSGTPSPDAITERNVRHELVIEEGTGKLLGKREILLNDEGNPAIPAGSVISWVAYVDNEAVGSIQERPGSLPAPICSQLTSTDRPWTADRACKGPKAPPVG